MDNYLNLMEEILDYGDERMDRTGVGTKALFGRSLEFDLTKGFPAVTTKRLYFKSVAAELAGFLEGTQSAARMRQLGTGIWDANAHAWKNGEPDNMGRVYGAQWRGWFSPDDSVQPIDQLRDVVDRIKSNPTDRRLIVTAWNPGELNDMCLPPCHTHFQFFVRGGTHLDCMFYIRSVDTFLGMPFDIASYALLTHIVANETGLKAGRLTMFTGDTHVYLNHQEQAWTQIDRQVRALPVLALDTKATIDNFHPDMVELFGYNPHPPIKAEMAV